MVGGIVLLGVDIEMVNGPADKGYSSWYPNNRFIVGRHAPTHFDFWGPFARYIQVATLSGEVFIWDLAHFPKPPAMLDDLLMNKRDNVIVVFHDIKNDYLAYFRMYGERFGKPIDVMKGNFAPSPSSFHAKSIDTKAFFELNQCRFFDYGYIPASNKLVSHIEYAFGVSLDKKHQGYGFYWCRKLTPEMIKYMGTDALAVLDLAMLWIRHKKVRIAAIPDSFKMPLHCESFLLDEKTPSFTSLASAPLAATINVAPWQACVTPNYVERQLADPAISAHAQVEKVLSFAVPHFTKVLDSLVPSDLARQLRDALGAVPALSVLSDLQTDCANLIAKFSDSLKNHVKIGPATAPKIVQIQPELTAVVNNAVVKMPDSAHKCVLVPLETGNENSDIHLIHLVVTSGRLVFEVPQSFLDASFSLYAVDPAFGNADKKRQTIDFQPDMALFTANADFDSMLTLSYKQVYEIFGRIDVFCRDYRKSYYAMPICHSGIP